MPPTFTFEEGHAYKVTFYASHHTRRTSTRKLRLVVVFFPGEDRETFRFSPLRGGMAVVLSPADIINYEEI